MERYNTKEQQKLIDDTREEILQRMRNRIKKWEREDIIMRDSEIECKILHRLETAIKLLNEALELCIEYFKEVK